MFGTWIKNLYNRYYAKKYGWRPAGFGVDKFNKRLVEKIEEFQVKHSLKPTGVCDKRTFKLVALTILLKIRKRKKQRQKNKKK